MINIYPLYSSSSGNMFCLESTKTDILIDVGVTYKALNDGLHSINKTIKDIEGVLITHEHIDHIKAIPLLCRKNNIPIYACGKTADYIINMLEEKNIEADVKKINYGQSFKIKDLEITPFETSHDAIMPCGFNIKNNNLSLGFATDLGYISNEVFDYLKDSNYVVIESNYDKTMLDFGKYPFQLKSRIKSTTGHLSNEDCGHAITKLYNRSGVSNFLLAHLSTNNNDANIAKTTIEDILITNNLDPFALDINIASKTLSSEVYTVC